jgi:uncharacterized membrane protein
MLRGLLTPPASGARKEPWTLRGESPGRLENFSDCTFSFALTLLVIATEVPKSYDDLIRILPGFFSFGACFVILSILWHRHVVFFRRYGLSDTATVALNTALLAVVLCYLYPLKFLMTTVVDGLRGGFAGTPHAATSATVVLSRVMPLYLVGFALVALAFTLLFRHALRRREELNLSEFEEGATRDDMILWLIGTGAALMAGAWCAWMPQGLAPSGTFVLFSIPLVRRWQRRRRREPAGS